jgi:AcrR family transcriptional regulator
MGREGSSAWNAILDGAEAILRDDGYAALSSRTVANRVGVNQQLIYYYFRTMDDLIVAAFRRCIDRERQKLDKAVKSPRPLREMWDAFIHTEDNRLIAEFTALAHRSTNLRQEVIAYITDARRIQIEALTKALKGRNLPPVPLPAAAVVVIANSVGLALGREAALGVAHGHAEVEGAIGKLLAATEKG